MVNVAIRGPVGQERALEALALAGKCSAHEVTRVTVSHSSLARTSHVTTPRHKGIRKCSPTTCPERCCCTHNDHDAQNPPVFWFVFLFQHCPQQMRCHVLVIHAPTHVSASRLLVIQ